MQAFFPLEIRRIRRNLLDFYDADARPLPWRAESDPYRIWISEVMLQQTRVDTVIGYYRRWMARFPDVEALADAEMEEVLQLWKGLGYYSRARNLRDAAAVVRESYGGRLPDTVPALRELPGVGEYTAGAVASIAFNVPTPAVDGNVRRVLSRLRDLPDPGAAELRDLAGELVDPVRPGDFNQALMELGATVCTPRVPVCGRCPISMECRALKAGTVDERPGRKKKAAVREAIIGVAVVVAVGAEGAADGDAQPRVLLRRRPDNGLLPGLWEFPGQETIGDLSDVDDADGAVHSAALCAVRAAALGAVVAVMTASDAWRSSKAPPALATVEQALDPGRPLAQVRHIFSHLKASYRPFLFRTSGKSAVLPEEGDGVRWVALDAMDSVPLSRAQQHIARTVISAFSEYEPD